jgi:hypothetical protein
LYYYTTQSGVCRTKSLIYAGNKNIGKKEYPLIGDINLCPTP